MKSMSSLMAVFLMITMSASVLAVPTDYVVLSWSENSGLQVKSYQVVDLPENKYQLKSPPDRGGYVSLIDNDNMGDTIYVSLKNERLTRSEHHGHEHIDGKYIENEEQIFVLKSPHNQNISVQVFNENQRKVSPVYRLKNLLENVTPKTSNSKQVGGLLDNRVNLLIMGDGYTSAEENSFNADADAVIDKMLTFEPYKSYGQFVRFNRLFTASNESGADHPVDPCGDGVADPLAPLFVDTGFDATYCTANIQRLLTVDSAKVFTAAAAIPNWDAIVVIVNDTTYGGAGGSFSTISTNVAAADVFIHEYGHSFTGLADEYDTPFPGFPACSDTGGGDSCEANVTDEMNAADIKWSYLIDGSTPIPTPDSGAFDNLIGLFEGARYQSSGMYRPKRVCNMRTLGSEFCEVCQEAYVLELYAGNFAGQGQPLSLIEPASQDPLIASVTGMVSVPSTFKVKTLQPTHDLNVRWFVDDILISDITSSEVIQEFEYTPTAEGLVSVRVRVKDRSPLVDSSRFAELPFFEFEWTLNVQALNDLIFADGFE